MIRTEKWKLIHYPKIGRYQLFDMQNDPLEKEDLFGRPCWATVFADLRVKLKAWQQDVGDPLFCDGRD